MADERDDLQVSASTGHKHRVLPFVIIILLMGIEGVGVFLLAKAIGPNPVTVAAAEPGGADGSTGTVGAAGFAEIELAECRPSNKMSGKFISFQIRISILVRPAEQERAERLVESKRARLRDRTNFVIRSAELQHLNDPALQTIRRRLKHEYDRLFGDDELVQEVLIPEWLQSNPGV